MSLQPFSRLRARAAALPRAHVDTDQIIPKQFLTRLERSGYGRCCFHDWRWLPDGSPDPAFELNRPEAVGAAILLAGENFGCGSSREHAAWALRDAGFRVIIAPGFADIFAENAVNTGIVPARVSREASVELFAMAGRGPLELIVDLAEESIIAIGGFRTAFEITPHRKHRLRRGLDPIGVTLQYADDLTAFEARQS